MSLTDYVQSLSPTARDALLFEVEQRLASNRIRTYFADDGPLRRELYPRHLQFFAAGAIHQERAFIAANRVGKTTMAAYEVALHLTGEYPPWWIGKRFAQPVDWWVAGDTAATTRDVPQLELMGKDMGDGMIRKSAIIDVTRKAGTPGAVDMVTVRHATGGISRLGFKAYEQGRHTFQGTKKDGIWVDEEPPEDVYDECMLRLMTTNGLMMCTFTPLKGLTQIALRFLPHLALPELVD